MGYIFYCSSRPLNPRPTSRSEIAVPWEEPLSCRASLHGASNVVTRGGEAQARVLASLLARVKPSCCDLGGSDDQH